MIKLVVSNMYCGHCQLKVDAELKANGFDVISIDMANNTVIIDTDKTKLSELEAILDSINYVVDRDASVLDLNKYVIWDEALEDDRSYKQFMSFLNKSNIEITGFDDVELGLVILSTDQQYYDIMTFINTLNQIEE